MDERCTDALIWELMLQAGPVGMFLYIMMPHLSLIYDSIVNVHLPKDRISMAHQGYGFCEFLTEEDAEYACKIMNQIKLWGKPIRVNKVRLLSAYFSHDLALYSGYVGLFRQKTT